MYMFFLLFIILLSAENFAMANPLNDINNPSWVYDIIETLEKKGIIEGYPDGYFKGKRPLTRYEMAMAVARIIARTKEIEFSSHYNDLSSCITKEDIRLINKMIDEFDKELNSLGIKTDNLEVTINKLDSRIEELEKIRITGSMNVTGVSIGYSPDDLNTSSFGNPYPPSPDPTPGPSVIYDRDRYGGPNGGAPLYQGSAIMSKLDLNISGSAGEYWKFGADFAAFSAFGEKGIIDDWGLLGPYNSMGQIIHKFNFQAGMSTLWVETDGNFDLKGKFGDFNPERISKNLFSGIRNSAGYAGLDVIPMNGINISGNIYKTLDMEFFVAKNINTVKAGDTTGIPSNFRYILATPYNNGTGCYRTGKYGLADAGQYDNYLKGLWFGYNFLNNKGHIEGAYLKIYEDYASNPLLGIDKNLTAPPKDTIYYGLKGSYNTGKFNIYGEINQTKFDYNLLDGKDGYRGTFLNTGIKVKMTPFILYGEFFRIDANYDPMGFHQHWGRLYQDGFGNHDGWSWGEGLFGCNGRRFSTKRPNRTGIDTGLNVKFGKDYKHMFYGSFTYMEQVRATMITDDENSFGKYDFATGTPLEDLTGINIYGNGEHMFTLDDPAKGKEYSFETGLKYRTGRFHIWGYGEYHNFKRNYRNRDYSMDISYYFANAGITCNITQKLGIQGYIDYIKCTGLNETGKDVKWRQIIPGIGVRYNFDENTELIVDYKFYNYSSEFPYDVYDKVPGLNNDYNANKLMTRLKVKF